MTTHFPLITLYTRPYYGTTYPIVRGWLARLQSKFR
jgi:hypothetical protein